MITLKSVAPLFVFEMANNHMGNVEHGLRIIREFYQVSRDFNFHFGFKLQYRNLESFIHPEFRERDDIKYIKRFSDTRLGEEDLRRLKDEMQTLGFVTVCTPFDERSVDLIEKHAFDVIKIGSCSFTDWSLLEHIAKTDKPIIASTAGALLEDIDKVVSFLEHRKKDFAIMHCVGEYPTENEQLQLNQIGFLGKRYPKIMIGFSTHENPDNEDPVKIAIAKGASIFEKHVGISTAQVCLNAYSATPEKVRRWLAVAQKAFDMCGVSGRRPDFSKDEISTLNSLRRGAFAKHTIPAGSRINPADVFFAIPTMEDQVLANDMSKHTEFYAKTLVVENKPLIFGNMNIREPREKIYSIVRQVEQLLRASGIIILPEVDLEISHHYGIDRFYEFGLTMMTIVNREYCKKLIVLVPGQQHPEQYHILKEETFHILHGKMWVNLDGIIREYGTGEIVVVERGVKHSFGTEHGVVIEEISSTHHKNDSFYTDPMIMQNDCRKTLLTHWMEV